VEADLRETLMNKENLESEVYPTARRIFSDDSDYNEFQDLNNTLSRPSPWAAYFKQAIRFLNVHNPKSQIDLHLNEDGWKIP